MPHKPARYGRRTIREERELTERLSSYRIMYIIVQFDLPTDTPHKRRVYTHFRKGLLKDGFFMSQFSIYVRPCASFQNAETHIKRIEAMIPEEGHICIFSLTEKQYRMMKVYWGYGRKGKYAPEQVTMFTEDLGEKPKKKKNSRNETEIVEEYFIVDDEQESIEDNDKQHNNPFGSLNGNTPLLLL